MACPVSGARSQRQVWAGGMINLQGTTLKDASDDVGVPHGSVITSVRRRQVGRRALPGRANRNASRLCIVEATVYESNSRYSSSFNSGDAQFTVRRGRDLQTVWVRTEEPSTMALSSISVTCGQESDELTAFCDYCHRRAYSLTSCGRKCRCLHMLCLECFHRHRCLWVATRVSRREIFSGFR